MSGMSFIVAVVVVAVICGAAYLAYSDRKKHACCGNCSKCCCGCNRKPLNPEKPL